MLHVKRRWLGPLDDKTECFKLRTEIFIEEQRFVEEFDQTDETALHLLLTQEEAPVATARIFCEDGKWWIGRICVIPQKRKDGIGSLALLLCEDKIRELGGTESFLNAQLQAQGFYERNGYSARGNVFFEEHCEHICMQKDITCHNCACQQGK